MSTPAWVRRRPDWLPDARPVPPAAVLVVAVAKLADVATSYAALRTVPGTTEAGASTASLVARFGLAPGLVVGAVLAVAVTVLGAEAFRVAVRWHGGCHPALPTVGQWAMYLTKAGHFALLAVLNARLLV